MQFVTGVADNILTEDLNGKASEAYLVDRMRPLWAAFTILHETKLDRNTRIVGFYVLLLNFWFERRKSLEIEVMISDLDCAEEVRETLKAVGGAQYVSLKKKAHILRLYISVSKGLGLQGGSSAMKRKEAKRMEKLIAAVERECGDLNIVLLAQGLLSCYRIARSNRRTKIRRFTPIQFKGRNFKIPSPALISKILNLLLCHQAPKAEHRIRRWDKETPAGIHSVWAALTFFLESTLPLDTRVVGFYSLAFHDWKEENDVDVLKSCLKNIDCYEDTLESVDHMTFDSFRQECELLFGRGPFVVLMKVLDKNSNFLDGIWMDKFPEKKQTQTDHLEKIYNFASHYYACYGPLFSIHTAMLIVIRSKMEMVEA